MLILGEGRVVWHLAIEAKPTEPAVDEVQVYLLAQPPFGTDAAAIANQSIRTSTQDRSKAGQ
jgi:hypothetical protein